MKKFYTVLMAAAAIVSANAAQKLEMSSALDMRADHTKGITKVEKAPALMMIPTKETKDDLGGIEGEYTWSYYSYINGQGASNVTITITLSNHIRQKYTVDLNGWEVEATFNAVSNTLSFEANQDLGFNDYNQIQVYFYHRIWNADGQGATTSSEPLVATYADGVFTFGDDDIIAIGNESAGWFTYADSNVFTMGAAAWEDLTMPADGWVDYGTGTYTDGWLVSGYTNVNNVPYEVRIEKNENEDGLYRIVNPYTGDCPIVEGNADAEGLGYIAFSIADPEFVTVLPGNYCGFTNSNGGYLPTNLEGYYSMNYDKETIISTLGITPSNYADGQANFDNLIFGTKDTPNGRYSWVDEEDNEIPMHSTLVIHNLSGIDGIATDSTIIPIEYYNLQGMRVMNPDNGIYIKKQGDKAIKVRVVR